MERRYELNKGLAMAEMDLEQLWLAYATVGGQRSPEQLAGFIGGAEAWPPSEVETLVIAVNDRLLQVGATYGIP